MKKTFPLHIAGRDDARVLEAIKGDIRKYLKRERRKKFPEGFDLWDFNCKIGTDEATATVTTPDRIIAALDRLAATDATHAYVEILAFPSKRPPRQTNTFAAPDAPTAARDDDEHSTDSPL
jgi:hypothetical protein